MVVVTEPEGIPGGTDDLDTRPVRVVRRQILVVDDVAANLLAAEVALAPLDLPVVTATSGKAALGLLLEQDFALILLDVQMPGMDGYETARWVRSRERTKHVPIIFMTAHSHDESGVLRAYALGAVDFLFKPLVPEVLRAKAQVFVTLQERTEQLLAERLQHEFENRRRDYETAALRRERDRELAAKQELARLNEALAASDRRKDSFIAILAHELRNPLAPIRTCIDLVREAPAQGVTPRMLDILDRQTTMLSRLVEDLLDLSRIKADKIELRPERTDLADIVEHAITISRPQIDERAHQLVLDRPDGPVVVVADTVRLTQVLANLLNNAARYTRQGGHIEVTYGARDDDAFIRVRDSGIGIPPELQATIFTMFVQERVASDGSGGLGLGLALAQRLVQLHQGGISAHSEGRDRGSTFEVTIPLASSPRALSPRIRTRDMEPLARPTVAPTSVRVLVIDDNEDARELLTALLESRGYGVLTAVDGPSGLEMLRGHQPHVAVIDLGLPGLDGVAVVEKLREECPSLATRLIALSGYGGMRDVERTRKAGFHAHLVKPAKADDLLGCVARLLADDR